MEAIYSSKLYRTSKRKDKIHSALQDPINVELVQQLREYLDEPEEEVKEVPEVEEELEVEEPVEEEVTEEETATESESFNDEAYSNPTRHDVVDTEVSEIKETPEEVEVKKEETISEPEKVEKEEIKEELPELNKQRVFHTPEKKEESTTTSEQTVEESVTVEAATVLYQQPVESSCCCPCDFVDAEAVRGTLNVRDDTKGVSRIFIKENELWIYYQDKINLNSVMEPVIEVLNSTGFTNLEFNRLARTENAIVFEISCVFQPVKSIKEEKEE